MLNKRRSQAGFAITEVLVATVVLAIGFLELARALRNINGVAVQAVAMTKASSLAHSTMERIMPLSFDARGNDLEFGDNAMHFDGDDDYVSTGIPYTDLLGAEEISISVSINWSSEDSDGGPSTAGIISNGSSTDGHQLDLNINNNGDKKLSLWWADNSTPGSPNM